MFTLSIGEAPLSHALIVYYLMPKLQSLLSEAKKFKEQQRYKYCWAKNFRNQMRVPLLPSGMLKT